MASRYNTRSFGPVESAEEPPQNAEDEIEEEKDHDSTSIENMEDELKIGEISDDSTSSENEEDEVQSAETDQGYPPQPTDYANEAARGPHPLNKRYEKDFTNKIECRRPLHLTETKNKNVLDNKGLWSLWILVGSVLITFAGPLLYSLFISSTTNVGNEKSTAQLNKISFHEQMNQRYPHQPISTFKTFSKLVRFSKDGQRKEDLITVITLLHNDTHTTANLIARDMASYAAEQFHSKTAIYELYGSSIPIDFGSRSYLNELKKTLSYQGAMVVYEFDKIETLEARKFHAICDKYTPFVDAKVVFILVLKTPLLKNDIDLKDQELNYMAQLTMKKLWEDMEKSSLDPLIVRLTDRVFQIKA